MAEGRGAAGELALRDGRPVYGLTLWQPWASFIVWGLKTIETRSWPPHHVPPVLAIHAAKTTRYDGMLAELWSKAGLPDPAPDPRTLPHGALVALAPVEGLGPTESARPSSVDFVLGDFRPQRFAWYLGRVQALEEPIPFRGRQGLFRLDHETTVDLLESPYISVGR